MSASEFLRKVTADEIAEASDNADIDADAAHGGFIDGPDYVEFMSSRLREHYPGLHQRIEDLVQGQGMMSPEELFVMGVFAGATMLAHDITVTAEAYDTQQMPSQSPDSPTS